MRMYCVFTDAPLSPALMRSKVPLRQKYEAEVGALVDMRAQLEAAGWTVEQVARFLHR